MNKFLLILILSLAAQSNELVFKEIKQVSDGSINVLFGLEKVSYINSYTLQNPSRSITILVLSSSFEALIFLMG